MPQLIPVLLRTALTARRVPRGSRILHAGTPLEFLYIIQSGMFKTYVPQECGNSQVTDFQLDNDVLGLDAIISGLHQSESVALEDSVVRALPYRDGLASCAAHPDLLPALLALVSAALVTQQRILCVVGSATADAKLAAFLIRLADRLSTPHQNPQEFDLAMTRADISEHLGVSLETISRAFTRLRNDHLISIENHRHIILRDRRRLLHCAQQPRNINHTGSAPDLPARTKSTRAPARPDARQH